MQPGPPRGACEPPGDGEQPEPEPFGFPPAGLVPGEGEQLHPGGELAGQGDDGAPDLVLGEAVQRQVGQPGVLGGADPVLGPGAAAVPQLQVGQLARARRWVLVANAVTRCPSTSVSRSCAPGMRSFLADDHPHPRRPPGQVEQPGQLGHPGPVTDLPVAVVGRCPRAAPGSRAIRSAVSSGRVNPTEYDSRRPVNQSRNAWVQPAPSVRISTFRPGRVPGRCPGSCAQRLPDHRDVVGGGVANRRSRAAAASPAAHRSRRRRGRRTRTTGGSRSRV